MNPIRPIIAGAVLFTLAAPSFGQKPAAPPTGKALLQSAYAAYDSAKTIQLRLRTLTSKEEGKTQTIEMTAVVENDGAGKISRSRLTMRDMGEPASFPERHLLEIGDESTLILPGEKKYAVKKREPRRLSDFFRSVLGSVQDEKTKYAIAEAKSGGVPVYQITTSLKDGLRATITVEKETRLFRRVLLTFRQTEPVVDIKVESQTRDMPIPEETFAKPGEDYMLDTALLTAPPVP